MMPIRIDPTATLIQITMTGEISLPNIMDTHQKLAYFYEQGSPPNILIDATCAVFDLDVRELQALVDDSNSVLHQTSSKYKIAIVIDNPIEHAISSVYGALRPLGLLTERRLFGCRYDAIKWIESDC